MQLVEPTVACKDSFITAVEEFQREDNIRSMQYKGLSREELQSDFEGFCRKQRERSLGKNLPKDFVADSIYWLVDNGEYIGRISIRHELNDKLRSIGGHIGYDVRPSKRGRGYATRMLTLALEKCRERSLDKVLITCDETNVASKRVIEKNGGVFEYKVPNPEGGPDKLRYWITLTRES